MRLSVKIESNNIDVFNSKNWNICCCGSEKCALSHGVGVSQGPVHDCRKISSWGFVPFAKRNISTRPNKIIIFFGSAILVAQKWLSLSELHHRILWLGGNFFLIEGPQRPPPGLSGLHVMPPLLSPATYVRPSPLPTPPLCAGACAPLGNAGMWCERAYGLCVCHPGITRGAHISSTCPTVSKPSCSSCATVSSPISLISSPIDFVFSPTYVILFPLPAHVYFMP